MNNLQKNIILSILFAVIIASMFLTDSSLVHTILVLLTFIVTIFLQGYRHPKSGIRFLLKNYLPRKYAARIKIAMIEGKPEQLECTVYSI